MKYRYASVMTFCLLGISWKAQASGPISSGGVPGTPFALRSRELYAILESQEVFQSIGQQRAIVGINYIGIENNSIKYLLQASDCTLTATIHYVPGPSDSPALPEPVVSASGCE